MLLPFVDILDGLLALICIIIALYLALMMVLYVFGIPRLVIHFSLSLPITRMAFLLFGVFSSKEIQSWLDPLIVWSVNGIWLLLNVSKLSMVMLVVLNVFKYLFSFSLLFPFFFFPSFLPSFLPYFLLSFCFFFSSFLLLPFPFFHSLTLPYLCYRLISFPFLSLPFSSTLSIHNLHPSIYPSHPQRFSKCIPFPHIFSPLPSPLFIFLSHCRPAHCSLMMNLLFFLPPFLLSFFPSPPLPSSPLLSSLPPFAS